MDFRQRFPKHAMVAALLTTQAVLLGWSGLRHSPTFDEVAHLPAGISHWLGEHRLFSVNPPLVRMVAAIPTLVLGAEYDWSALNTVIVTESQKRVDFEVGRDFIAVNGERAFWLYTFGRWACIPLVLIGGLVVWKWGCELYGDSAGLVSLIVWTFSPMVLGHGSLMTPDVPAASFGVLAMYRLWKWSKQPSSSNAYWLGLSMALAWLTKSTWLVLSPLLSVLAILAILQRFRSERGLPFRMAVQLVGSFALAWSAMLMVYQGDDFFVRLGDFPFQSRALVGPESADGELGNRFAESTLGSLPIPLPKQFVLGIDLQKSNFDRQTQSYLWGELRRGGWWYYYLFAVVVKTPIGVMGLILVATAVRASSLGKTRRRGYGIGSELYLLLPMLVATVLVSSQTGINKHLRYLLPAYPFAIIWLGQSAYLLKVKYLKHLVHICLGSFLCSSLWIFPHSLSYFNELVGGPRQGHHYLINSNIDWGQDLFYLRRKLSGLTEDSIGMVYWGNYDARLGGIDFFVPPRGTTETLPAGIYAISVNHLQGYAFRVPDERGQLQFAAQNSFSYFKQMEPIDSVGYSMLIYVVECR